MVVNKATPLRGTNFNQSECTSRLCKVIFAGADVIGSESN